MFDNGCENQSLMMVKNEWKSLNRHDQKLLSTTDMSVVAMNFRFVNAAETETGRSAHIDCRAAIVQRLKDCPSIHDAPEADLYIHWCWVEFVSFC